MSSPLLEVPLAQGVAFWAPTHAPQVSATHPGSVSTFLSHHAPGSSLGMTLSWVVTIPGITLRWRGLHESGYSPLVLELWPWSHLYLLSNLASGDFVPSTVFPTRGYRGATPSAPYTGDAISALSWRRPFTGDASSWRRLFFLATPHPPSSGPSRGPTVSLTLTLVNARGRDSTGAFLFYLLEEEAPPNGWDDWGGIDGGVRLRLGLYESTLGPAERGVSHWITSISGSFEMYFILWLLRSTLKLYDKSISGWIRYLYQHNPYFIFNLKKFRALIPSETTQSTK